jgi:hypothetical protein
LIKPVKAIIHGHFYQPPREDPWTNIIYDQESAYPFKNWNERITRECYGPNCYSRVLDKDGKITDIINNYKYMSFNFGPTLLGYLEREEREIYEFILEADRYSVMSHNGHGNAIAQVYNHVILPLQTDEDKRTQIHWGLKDFEKRFGRKSEGIWLSETAIDPATAGILVDYGVKFVILSPNQAESYRKIGDEKWTKNSEHPVRTTHAYKLRLEAGDLNVFYFDRALSTAVSFEHLLRNSDNFAHAIMNGRNMTEESDAVIIATDGEVYGHHEPFADMCLASLVKNYHMKENRIEFMNFGEYLEKYPALYETQLSAGEDGRGSSWSCFHGIGRWYKNCGCHTGGNPGWNQKWRTPLREAFDIVKNGIDGIYKAGLKDMISSPAELRNGYIDFILSDYSHERSGFIDGYKTREISDDERKLILTLLESQKYSMFMYTSCGWFFSEISGIETVQNIRYAFKAIDLLGDKASGIRKEFSSKLEEAQSNLPENKNGRWILENWVYPEIQDMKHVANNFIMMLAFKIGRPENFEISKYFGYDEFVINDEKGGRSYGQISVFSRITGERTKFHFMLIEEKPGAYKNHLSQKHALTEVDCTDAATISQTDLLADVKERLLEKANSSDTGQIIAMNISQINRLREIMIRYHFMKAAIPHYLKNLFSNSAESYFHYIAKKLDDFPSDAVYSDLLKILEISRLFNINLDVLELKNGMSGLLFMNISRNPDPFSEICDKAVRLLNFCYKAGLLIEKSRCENIVFNFLKTMSPELIKNIDHSRDEESKMKNMLNFRKLLSLSDLFNINTEEEKKLFFKYF